MNITLKSVKFSESLSEETNAFTANVYAGTKRIGYAKNNGQGGNTTVNAFPEQRDLFRETERFLTEQPQINIGSEDRPFMIDSDMESTVNNLFEKWLSIKEEKKMQNRCKKGVIYKTNGGYSIITWTNINIEGMLKNPTSEKQLKKVVIDLIKDGKEIINTNLPKDWLN